MMTQPGLEQEAFKILLEKLRDKHSPKDLLEKMRLKSWQQFIDLGLPTRHHEAYRYIKLRHLFSHNYCLGKENRVSKKEIENMTYPECKDSVIVFINGDYSQELSQTQAIPQRVVISSLQEAVQTYGTLLNNSWTKSLKEEKDPFVALNGALHYQGAFVYFPPKSVIESPIQILHLIDTDDQQHMLLPRLQIFVGSHSNVKFIHTQRNLRNCPYFVNQTTEFSIDEAAHVHYSQDLCSEHPQSWHLDAIRAILKRDSTFKSICITQGSATVRTDYKIALTGENGEALLNGVAMLSDKSEAHAHVLMEHLAPHCRSYQLFKNALNNFSRSSFEGKILVRQPAQKTEAFQLNHNLLLNDHAHADSKPNLEIFADDVKASHGATVGQLDAEQMFYMKTRGFSDTAAKNLLVYGFCEEVIEMIPVASLRKEISNHARTFLEKKNYERCHV